MDDYIENKKLLKKVKIVLIKLVVVVGALNKKENNMNNIEVYSDKTIERVVNDFIDSKSFKRYHRNLINETLKVINGFTVEHFNLRELIVSVEGSFVKINSSYCFIPDDNVFYKMIVESESDALDILAFKKVCSYIVGNIESDIKNAVWGAIANYPVTDENGNIVPLGDVTDFIVKVESENYVDFGNVSGLK